MNNTQVDDNDEEIFKEVEENIKNSPSRIPKRIRIIYDGQVLPDEERPKEENRD